MATVQKPDLTVSNVTIGSSSLIAGGSTMVTFTIRNVGNAVAGASTTKFYLTRNGAVDANAIQLISVSTPQLAANGGFQSGSFALSSALTNTLASGSYTIIAVTDADNVVGESNEINNRYASALTITRPDLTVGNLTIGSSSLAAGASTTVNFTIQNVGNALAMASTAGIYLNNNGNLTLLRSVSVSVLAANGGQFNSGYISVALPAALATGSYSIVVAADINNVVAESNESNNSLGKQISVLENTAKLFSFFGGQLSALARLADAAYHLDSHEIARTGVNSPPSQGAENDYALLSRGLNWLTAGDLPSLAPISTNDANFRSKGLVGGGIYVNSNAAALVGRSADSLFISFRGTNDERLPLGSPDVSNWVAKQDYWNLLSQFVSAVDQYVNTHPEITRVYVAGHSLGASMAQAYMSTHPGDKYQAVTFASPGYNVGLQVAPDTIDDRIINIWDDVDPIVQASGSGQFNVRGDQYFVAGQGFNLASGDLFSGHYMSLYEQIADAMNRSQQQWQVVDGKVDRATVYLSDGNYSVAKVAFGPPVNTAASSSQALSQLAQAMASFGVSSTSAPLTPNQLQSEPTPQNLLAASPHH